MSGQKTEQVTTSDRFCLYKVNTRIQSYDRRRWFDFFNSIQWRIEKELHPLVNNVIILPNYKNNLGDTVLCVSFIIEVNKKYLFEQTLKDSNTNRYFTPDVFTEVLCGWVYKNYGKDPSMSITPEQGELWKKNTF